MATKAANKRIENIISKMLEVKTELDALKKKHTTEQNKLGERYNKWEVKLHEIMKEENMNIFQSDNGFKAERKMAIHGNVKDPKKLHNYIVKNDAWDLLGNNVKTLAYRQRLEDGERVPGVESFKKFTINVKKLKGKN